jgi:putative peptide maturation dehydrogenase
MRVRRSRYLFFFCQDEGFVDIESMLRGATKLVSRSQLYGISILTGQEHAISPEELTFVLSVPSDRWLEIDESEAGAARALARSGLLVSDDEDDALTKLRRREVQLAACQWNVYGALYHFMTKWRDVDLRADVADEGDPLAELPPLTKEAIEEFVALHGKPPDAFHSVAKRPPTCPLPLVTRDDGLYAALARRKTTRTFDRETPMTIEELALVLYYVFGCHGYAEVPGDIVTLRRTSPSGGGLHPIEVYPLVTNVDDIEPGLYHYDARTHALELVSALELEKARILATEFVCGQTYFGSAHVAFVMTARFYRNFWKYRKHQKAYAAVLMDAAHLSQTLYLVSADLGLGAFFTGAINSTLIEEHLGLEGCAEGVVALAGCGRRAAGGSPFEPRFSSYVPRETMLA